MTEALTPTAGETTTETAAGGVRWGRLLIWTAMFGLLAGLGWKMWQNSLQPVSTGLAPDFTLNTFDGQTLRLSELRGNVVVINFWASWCLPCREEAPVLEAAWREYRDRGVMFIGVDYLDPEADALAYLAEFDITYPNGPDLGTQIAPSYRIKGIPETFFVDAAGEARDVFIGPINAAELRRRIEALLVDEL